MFFELSSRCSYTQSCLYKTAKYISEIFDFSYLKPHADAKTSPHA